MERNLIHGHRIKISLRLQVTRAAPLDSLHLVLTVVGTKINALRAGPVPATRTQAGDLPRQAVHGKIHRAAVALSHKPVRKAGAQEPHLAGQPRRHRRSQAPINLEAAAGMSHQQKKIKLAVLLQHPRHQLQAGVAAALDLRTDGEAAEMLQLQPAVAQSTPGARLHPGQPRASKAAGLTVAAAVQLEHRGMQANRTRHRALGHRPTRHLQMQPAIRGELEAVTTAGGHPTTNKAAQLLTVGEELPEPINNRIHGVTEPQRRRRHRQQRQHRRRPTTQAGDSQPVAAIRAAGDQAVANPGAEHRRPKLQHLKHQHNQRTRVVGEHRRQPLRQPIPAAAGAVHRAEAETVDGDQPHLHHHQLQQLQVRQHPAIGRLLPAVRLPEDGAARQRLRPLNSLRAEHPVGVQAPAREAGTRNHGTINQKLNNAATGP